jgi:hypothetical protein
MNGIEIPFDYGHRDNTCCQPQHGSRTMTNIIKRFLKSEAGNFGMILGLTIAPVMMSVGAAVDYTGFKRLETRMVLASEAALIAATKEMVRIREEDYNEDSDYDLTNAQLVEELDRVFKPFFEANFSAGGYELTQDQYTLEFIEADNDTKVRVTMNYDTAVMVAFGRPYLIAENTMTINMKIQPRNYVIDIVMCIDATGSMQNTLNAVKANAMTFNSDLRAELGIGEYSDTLKIRVRPIFYRDWEEGRDYLDAMEIYEDAYDDYLEAYEDWETGDTGGGDGLSDSERNSLINKWNSSSWYYKEGSRYKKSKKWWMPKEYKRVKYEGDWYYFRNLAELNTWMDELGGGSGTGTGPMAGDPPTPPVKPVNHGLNMYPDFIDLDPSETETIETGIDRDDRNTELTNFLGSTYAFGGHDWPEAAGACLNEAIRSDWYDVQSNQSRAYFKANPGDVIISDGDAIPSVAYTQITDIPIVVFWSDATINSLQLSRDYLSETTPTSYSTFENLWNGAYPAGDPDIGSGRHKMSQDRKMMVRFGPENASGWNTIDDWDKYYYGGSLNVGNQDAVEVIAEKILESIPDILRVGS